MKAILLSIGDELLIGQVVNTNASWLGEQLTGLGITVERVVALGDDESAIERAIREARREVELVVVTGGLGPTHDDVTKTAVARIFGVQLNFDEKVFEGIKERLARRGRTPSGSIRGQAMVPEGFDALPNPVGTAPGLWKEDDQGILVVTAGVPHEMKAVFSGSVLPRLRTRDGLPAIAQRTLLTTGSGESNLQDLLGAARDYLADGQSLAFLPSIHGVRVRLTARAADAKEVADGLKRLESFVRERIGTFVFGTDPDSLEAAIGRHLIELRETVGTAESCTGGLISHRLTNIAGSSAYVHGSVVAYDNSVKTGLLAVPEAVVERHGAVSETVARHMAEGVREALNVGYGLATTGIMGPGGGSEEKPVGTVWIACAGPDGTHAVRSRFPDERVRNKERTATAALGLLLRILKRSVNEE